jgi:hypothetical protein
MDQTTIGRQIRMRGSFDEMFDAFREIQIKAEPRLVIEGGKGYRPSFRISFADQAPREFEIGPLNPPLALSTKQVTRGELLRLRSCLYKELQRIDFPSDDARLGVYDIRDRRTLKSCFSDWPARYLYDIHLDDFFRSLRLVEGLRHSYMFEKGPGPWIVVCSPAKGWTWARVKEVLRQEAVAVPVKEKYGLGSESAALLQWIVGLGSSDFLGTYTPVVEDHLELDIGLKVPWHEENVPAYLAMLLDEINSRTDFDLRLQPWCDRGRQKTRIRVARRTMDFDRVVREVQLLGLSRNKLLDSARVKAALGLCWLEP